MRILFAGSPSIAVPSLTALSQMEYADKNIQLVGLLTNPDSAQGRKSDLIPTETASAVAAISAERLSRGLPPVAVLKFDRLNAAAREQAALLKCDLLVCFAYGRIFGPKFLSLFPLGGINIHPSLLPRFRGPAPIQAAILSGDDETGITIQAIAPEMDSGVIFAQEKIKLGSRETASSLGETVSLKAAEMLSRLIPEIAAGSAKTTPQTGEPSYCSIITREQGRIDWKSGAIEIDAKVRAYNPWPLCFTQWGNESLNIIEGSVFPNPDNKKPDETPGMVLGIDRAFGILIQTGNGVYAVSHLQRQTKKAMDWKAFINGARDFSGSRLE